MRSFLVRVVAVAALVVGSAVAMPAASRAASTPSELSYACALKSNGQLRAVNALSQCGKNEVKLTIKPGPVLVCVQPSGSSRYVTSFSSCKPPARTVTLPPTSGSVYFCADNATRVLRYVTDPSQCSATETPYVVTPNDAAPTVVGSTPANGATHVSTTPAFSVTFSEPVQLSTGAFTFQCGGVPWAGGVPWSGGSTTFLVTPLGGSAPEGATCVLTVVAGNVHDLDSIDPPDTMTGDVTISVTTDTAPAVSSVSPTNNATGVAVSSTVAVTFSEPVTFATSDFALTCAATAVALSAKGSGTSTATLTPTTPLPPAAQCGLTVTAGGIHDVDTGDPPDTLATNFTSGFTTADQAPAVVSTSPADGATDVSPGTAVSVTFSEPVTTEAGAFTLVCDGTGVPVTFDPGPALTIAVAHASALPKGASCTLTTVAAHVSDVDGVDPVHPASDASATFGTATNTAPTAIDLSPRAVAENQPVGTTVGSLSTTDADAGDTFTYTLVTGAGDTDNALFSISGSSLTTAAVLDTEAGATRSVRVRSTDSGNATVEQTFTITVTDVNEAPTALALTPADVDENKPVGTTVGTLSASDPDLPAQTLTYSIESSGCGGSYPDGAAFSVTGTSLKTAQVLDYEAKSSYDVCVRVTDSGSPALATDKVFTVTVNDVNDPPTTLPDSYTGAVGNTMFALNLPATPGPRVAVTGSVLTANDSDQDAGDSLSAVPETVTSTGGGTATIDAAGNFTFLPGVGDKSQDDTFTYHVVDSHGATAPGTVTVTIGATLVWWVDNSSGATAHDGRSTSPLTSLGALNGPDATDLDGTGDTIFVYTGNATYAGGLHLEANQALLGERAGVTVGPLPLVAPGSTPPVLTNAAGNGVDLANGTTVSGIDVANASGDGVNGVGISTASVGSGVPMTISGSGADGVDISGAGSGALTIGASVTTSSARSLAISGRTGSTVAVTGSITGKGVELASNSGATINLTGGLALSTTTTPALSATGGGTVTVTGSANTASSTTGGGVIVENTTIGAPGMTFRSVSANGAANGIRLTNTGSTGSLSVTGTGSTAQGGDASGGTIQATTGAGISLIGTRAPSFNNVSVLNVPTAPGVAGTGVTGFSFTNGRVSGSGLSGSDLASANLAFNGVSTGVNNLSGAVSVANTVLENAYGSGIDVYNQAGTISSLSVTGNLIQSTTSAATSKGSGVLVQAVGSSSTAGSVTGGSISSNAVRNFPSNGGIQLIGGNITSAAAPVSSFGTGATPVQVNANLVQGASTAVPMATQGILVSMAGRGTGVVNVTNNGTGAAPVGLLKGNGISVNSTGAFDLTSSITGNVVSPQAQAPVVASGIAGGADSQVMADTSTLDSAVLRATVSNNTVSGTDGVGIRFLANSRGSLLAKVQNNTVAASSLSDGNGGAVGNYGIRVDSGTSSGTAVDTNVCLLISGNTTAGSTTSSTGITFPGIGLRKQGTVDLTNDFGIVGLTPNPATAPLTESYVSSQNQLSTTGTFGTGGTAVVSGSNFIPCALTF